ncbi:heme NO-binding domain-containing protein [Paraglaciecola arctica]|uniref:2,4-dihydroxyhept-2-ene-1,7-dioic acid aldolase n=1 Tax=Paraglaciecola arctica BSs20135 TaxID=493475 RepID=K6Z585_9ALTE|nr:heme NO-binding domain-containing protein [Paraglaciecola arctica]GAC18595.1 2,4-dihydroxyhept-2-ene-1,7-dioic acid aldolase [Paraglaciecola arctica BSs20135]
MKGMVFTEFMDMVEEVFSADILEDIIEKSELPNNGAYTAVGTYSHEEIVTMTANLSQIVDIPVATLLEIFGKHLFARFSERYPAFFADVSEPFEFLKNIDNYIHVEVRKLYPDAELPRFYHQQKSATELTMYYLSSRHFEDLAVGLIMGCLAHFKVTGEVCKTEGKYQGEEAIEITIKLF